MAFSTAVPCSLLMRPLVQVQPGPQIGLLPAETLVASPAGCQFNGAHPVWDGVLRALVLTSDYKVSEQPLCGPRCRWQARDGRLHSGVRTHPGALDHQFDLKLDGDTQLSAVFQPGQLRGRRGRLGHGRGRQACGRRVPRGSWSLAGAALTGLDSGGHPAPLRRSPPESWWRLTRACPQPVGPQPAGSERRLRPPTLPGCRGTVGRIRIPDRSSGCSIGYVRPMARRTAP